MKPSAKLLPADHTYAEQLLIQAKNRADAKAAAAAAAAAAAGLLTPVKQKTQNQLLGLLSPLKLELRNRVDQGIENYKTNNNNITTVPQSEIDNITQYHKNAIKKEKLDRDIQHLGFQLGEKLTKDQRDAVEAQHKEDFKGFGLKQSRIIKHKQEFNSKYAIDKTYFKKYSCAQVFEKCE